jgi:MFS superfamily sulfate permease-like transporter
MSSFDMKNLTSDFKSGLVVALVAFPLCLGISLASGAPLISGLIAGIIGGLIIGSLSSSHVSVSGPAAGLAVIVFGAIQDLGSFNIFLCAVVLAGFIQLLLGLFKAGVVAHFFPVAVIEGMLSSIGLLLILKQFPIMIGMENFKGYLDLFFEGGWQRMQSAVLILGIGCFFLFLIYENTKLKNLSIFKIIPFSVFLVVLASLAAALLPKAGFELQAVNFVNLGELGNGGAFSSIFTFPDFNQFLNPLVIKYAFILAIVASIETLLCLEAGDKMDAKKRVSSTNVELKAQGIGNMLSGLIGGLPLTSVIVRTSVNIQSGAQSKFSAIFHGLILFAGIALFPKLLTMIPLAVLAVILVISGFKLLKPDNFKKFFHCGPEQYVPFFVTILSVVIFDLLTGVLIGIGVASFMILKNNYLAQTYHLEHRSGKKGEKHVIHLGDYVTFLSKGTIKKQLSLISGPGEVTIDLSKTLIIDHDVKEVIDDFMISAKNKKITVEIINPDNKGIPERLRPR